MKPPDESELEQALSAAERMRERDVDPHHLAHALLYLHQRNQRLEEVLRRTDRYLRFGMAEPELTQLRKLVQRLRDEEESDRPLEGDTSMFL